MNCTAKLEIFDEFDDPTLALGAAILWRAVADVQEFGYPPDVREFFASPWYAIITGALGLDEHTFLRRVSTLPVCEYVPYPRQEKP